MRNSVASAETAGTGKQEISNCSHVFSRHTVAILLVAILDCCLCRNSKWTTILCKHNGPFSLSV